MEISSFPHFRELCGVNDERLRLIEKTFSVEVRARNGSIFLTGTEEEIKRVSDIFSQFNELVESGVTLKSEDLKFIWLFLKDNRNISLKEIFSEDASMQAARKLIVPRSVAQKAYINALTHSDMVISIGPAGTGKTYLAMAVAVAQLLDKKTGRIVLTRPAVEAGESLGYLPGDLTEKITPYLRPLYDALSDILGADKLSALMNQGRIEVAPLAYMRGRTLNDSFIVLDEAQNCTSEQMKMFLTRLGMNSKAVITGDITQIDLQQEKKSGLIEAQELLSDIEGIDFIYFSKNDVVRHPLVSKIIGAYEANGKRENS